MKRLLIMLSVLSLMAFGASAPTAFALTKAQAEFWSLEDAFHKWLATSVTECAPSGKNEKGHAQYYCKGYVRALELEWKINLDPYGEITFESH
jgi:hypothetical protein